MSGCGDSQLVDLRARWRSFYFKAGLYLPHQQRNRLGATPQLITGLWQQFVDRFALEATLQLLTERLRLAEVSAASDATPAEAEGLLKIHSDWLLVWFCAEALRAIQTDELAVPGGEVTNQLARVRQIHRITVLVLFALHVLEYPDPKRRPDFIDTSPLDLLTPMTAQIELMAEYAYRALGVNRELGIEEHLKRLVSPQILLYSAKHAYR
ncbi:MAG TPA: hypothetical protein HPP83_10880, partial [Candidatus Hydrogenedentes bacterium]|nr:hypothetical protein [Candidatus Hydrogenedentota bacterium]